MIFSILMRRFFSGTILACLFLGLVSCATRAPSTSIPWPEREKKLSHLSSWDMKATVAIRNNNHAESMTLRWQQQKINYTLLFFGPLGTQLAKLTGSPNQVEMETGNGQKWYASSPELLLAEQTGWRLPVSHLYYWIRGLPVPKIAFQSQQDAFHRFTLLIQDGWQIQFIDYTLFHDIDLPRKIVIDNSPLMIKIIIHRWGDDGH